MIKRPKLLLVLLIFLFPTISKSQVASLDATLKLNNINGVNVPYQNGIPVPSFEKQDRQIIDLKGTWKKQRFSSDDNITLAKRDGQGINNLITEAQNRFEVSYDDISWTNKNIPSVENEMHAYPTVPEYYEDGVWYRYKFNVADTLNGKYIKLMFYAVNYVADVWMNGHYLGYHEGGYTPFAFDVSSALNYGGENVIAVRVDNPKWGTRNDIVPYVKADWFNYTGIIHDVYLEVSNPINVVRTNVVPLNIDGTIETTVTLLNKNNSSKNVDINIEIFNAEINNDNINTERASELIGASASFSGEAHKTLTVNGDTSAAWRTNLIVANPRLWSPKEPNLYVMKVTLKENGVTVDEYYAQFGIRIIRTDNSKVLLNGKYVFFTGVARHEDHPVYGRSIPIDVIYSDLLKVKEVNANMLRTAHYPNHLQTYLLADRLGIAILEEIPVWWFDEAASWNIQTNIRHIHEQMFREMVFKDYNRPSIFMWSTCNECLDVPNRKIYIQKIKNDISVNYPDGRFVTQSAAADRPGITDASQTECDVAGWTMYFGIFHGSEYYLGTNYFLVTANISFPAKPILDTEFGYWSSETGSSAGTQVKVFTDTWQAFARRAVISPFGFYDKNGYLMGVTWWCIFDWYSSQHPSGFQSMGLFSMDRTVKKPVADTLAKTYALYYNMGGTITAVNDKVPEIIPTKFSVEQNFPNPFNPSTDFEFQIPPGRDGSSNFGIVTLKIYDVLGKEVATVINEELTPGKYHFPFSISHFPLSSGVYFYKLTSGDYSKTMKMLLLK